MGERWPVEVRFGGLGGQGLVTLGAVLADAGARAGLQVAASQSYGSRARGGATRSDVILSAVPIDFPHVHHPDLIVVLAKEAYDLYSPDVRPGGAILCDEFFVHKVEIRPDVSQHLLPGTALAMEQLDSRVAANFVMLGAALGFSRLLGEEHVQAAMAELVSARFVELNLKALGLGLAQGRALAERHPWR